MNGRFRRLLCAAVALVGTGAFAQDVVWTGTQTVDRVVRFEHGQNLVLRPGTRVEFVGEGRISVRDAGFRAEGAEFVATATLTNGYRIAVRNGGLDMKHCRLAGLRSHQPVKGVNYFLGSVHCSGGGGSKLTDCVFVDCSAVAYVCSDRTELAGNVFIRPHMAGAYLFNVTNCRVSGNEFFDASEAALNLSGAQLTEVTRNRFTDCALAFRLRDMRGCRLVGNSVFGGGEGMVFWSDRRENVFLGNLFEGVKHWAVSTRGAAFAGDEIFANNLIARCGNGFNIPKLPAEHGFTVRDNVFVETGVALALGGGTLVAPNNAVWKSRSGCVGRKGTDAQVTTPGLVTADPLFRDAAACDWRLRDGSPLRGAGSSGATIGIYP